MGSRRRELGHQTKIEDLDQAVALHEHVRRLQVAMEPSGAVQSVDAQRELCEGRAQVALGKRAAGTCRRDEVLAMDQVHRDVPLSITDEELMKTNQVGMDQV